MRINLPRATPDPDSPEEIDQIETLELEVAEDADATLWPELDDAEEGSK